MFDAKYKSSYVSPELYSKVDDFWKWFDFKRLDIENAIKEGNKNILSEISEELKNCDENYEIVASYTHNRENLDVLVSKIDEKYKKLIEVYDDLDLAIASHWGPNAFGFIYVEK